MKNKVRSIYIQLQGLLGQLPPVKEKEYLYKNDKAVWESYNHAIEELNELKINDYSNFKVEPDIDGDHISMSMTSFRATIGSLISRLHGEFFTDELPPFSSPPSTIISQNQSQNQSVTMLLEFQSFIDKKLSDKDIEQTEKNFLEKIKEALPTVKTSVELANLLLTTANTCGLNLDALQKIFH